MTEKQNVKFAALYCRYSFEEDRDSDVSNSIKNQKIYLEDYAVEHNISYYEFYVDDGYTGTMFERPAFKRMVADIENGTVDTVIVKDLSRFGRNYLQVGLYTELIFVEKHIRFISVNDSIDSFATGKSDDFVPFKNFMNEFYAKDISNKVKATISIKGKRGERLTSNPVYGYTKDENSDWIVDEKAAETVRRIFDLYEQGKGVKMIAGMLSEDNIPTPITRTGRKSKYNNWSPQTVRRILECREYCGDTVNFKTRKLSFKSKKHIKLPKEENMIFLDTQTAIISREQFDRVQELLLKKQRQPTKVSETSEPMLFKGIVKCKDCGAAMHGCRRTGTHPYTCSTYRKVYNRCTSHYIREDELIAFVKEQFTDLFELFKTNQLRAYLSKAVGQETQTELRNNQNELQTKRERVAEIDNVFKNLYEDKISGLITNEMFTKLYSKFEAEQNELKGQIFELSKSIGTIKCDENKINTFVSVIKKYSNNFEVMDISNEFLREIIDYIAVGEKVKEGTNNCKRELVICYRFLGNINLFPKK